MGKIILYIGILLTVSLNIAAKPVEPLNFMFQWSSVFDADNVQLKIIEEGQKKSVVIVRKDAIKPPGEVAIDFNYSDRRSANDKTHKVIGYKFQRLDGNMDQFFNFVRVYADILKTQYPHRFVVRKRTCSANRDEFFQCLYDEKESWNVMVYINNGEIALNLIPVVDESSGKLIGGAFMVTYTVGTGRYFNKTA